MLHPYALFFPGMKGGIDKYVFMYAVYTDMWLVDYSYIDTSRLYIHTHYFTINEMIKRMMYNIHSHARTHTHHINKSNHLYISYKTSYFLVNEVAKKVLCDIHSLTASYHIQSCIAKI